MYLHFKMFDVFTLQNIWCIYSLHLKMFDLFKLLNNNKIWQENLLVHIICIEFAFMQQCVTNWGLRENSNEHELKYDYAKTALIMS